MEYCDDLPISEDSEDLLNRSSFVHQLTAMLGQRLDEGSITVGIYGAWGCGKTSILNLVKSRLKDTAIVIDFNPWSFGNQNLALREFLRTLANYIQNVTTDEEVQPKWYWRVPIIGKALKERTGGGIFTAREGFGETLSWYADLAIDVGASLSNMKALTALKQKSGFLNHSGHLSDMKQELEGAILNCSRPIVVFIDDVDRLDREEIFHMFKIIKSVLNFRGVTYVLAFDDYAVGKALNSRFEDGQSQDAGRKYLEKIIQIPLRIPALRREDIDKMLLDAVAALLSDNEISLEVEEGERFRQIYDESFCKFFDTPRAIYRYLNALKFLLPSVKGEVDIVDFLILEIVRIFQPEVYARVFSEKQLLIEPNSQDFATHLSGTKPYDEAKERFDNDSLAWLQRLFPRVSNSENQQIILNSPKIPRKRVCRADYFDKFFIYGVSSDDVSDNAILNLVKTVDELELEKALNSLLSTSEHQDSVLNKIKDSTALCTDPEKLAFAILKQFDILSPETLQFRLPILQTASQLVVDLVLHTIDPSLPLAKIIRDCDNPEYLFYLIRSMHLFLSNKNAKTDFPELWEYLQPIIAHKIQSEASKNILHSKAHPHGHLLYKYWADSISRDATNLYLRKNLKNANDVLDFLSQYLPIWQSERDSTRGDLDKEVFDSICRVVDTDWMYDLLVREYPQYKAGCKYVYFNDFDGAINVLGQESTDEFRCILAQQFIALVQSTKIDSQNS